MTFEAKYGGRCGDCGDRIHPGDRVEYRDDELAHEVCDESPDDRGGTVCPDCFLIHPDGACDA